MDFIASYKPENTEALSPKDPLSNEEYEQLRKLLKKDRDGTVKIEFFCDGGGEDKFSFQIATGLKNKDLKQLELGKPLVKEMTIKLLECQSEEESIEEYEREREPRK